MNARQKITWVYIGTLLLMVAWFSSTMNDTGARMLTRAAIAVLLVISIRVFWIDVPTISRKQARINKIQRRHARGRASRGGGVSV